MRGKDALPLVAVPEPSTRSELVTLALTVLVAAIAAFAISLATVLVVRKDITDSLVRGCARGNDTRLVIRTILDESFAQSIRQHHLTGARLRAAQRIVARYKGLLRDVPCKRIYK